jgi:hypothetical protein
MKREKQKYYKKKRKKELIERSYGQKSGKERKSLEKF